MGPRWFALLFVILLLSPSVAAGEWVQYRGNGERSAMLDPLPGLLDVLDTGGLQAEPVNLGSNNYAPIILHSDAGWTWSEDDSANDTCSITTRQDLSDHTNDDVVIADACNSGRLQALDLDTGHTILCEVGGTNERVLRAVAPDGRDAWSVLAADLLGVDAAAGDAPVDWVCTSVALDPTARMLYVSVIDTCLTPGTCQRSGTSTVAAVDLDDGSVAWASPITDTPTQDGVVRITSNSIVPGQATDTQARGVSITDDHVLVTFSKRCLSCRGSDPAAGEQRGVAWFDRSDGTQIGIHDKDELETPEGSSLPANVMLRGSRFASTRDGRAIAYTGGAAVLIDPTLEEPVRHILVPSDDFAGRVPEAPVWWNERTVVASTLWLTSIDMEKSAVAWEWTGGPNWEVEHMIATSDGDLLVVLLDLDTDRGAKLVRISIASGTVTQEIPVAMDVAFATGAITGGSTWKIDMIPGTDGQIALVDRQGAYALLGPLPATDAPRLEADNRYPQIGEGLTLQMDASRDGHTVDRIEVSWGDGTRRIYGEGDTMEHRYADSGDRDIVATAVYEDGTTRSAKVMVHVGDDPPPDLNALQRAFAPENADVTWGVLGVLIAVFGGLMAFARSRVRKNRLEYKLAELERLKARAIHDVPSAIRDVDAYRSALRADLRRGKLDDIQYAVLEGEIQRSLRLWYHRLLAPYESRMSDRFRRHLTGSLEDGTLHAPEADRLVAELARENRLKAGEKAHLKAFFQEWSHGGTG